MHLQTLYQSAAVVAALLAPAKARVYHSNVQGTCAELHHLLASNETFTAESAYYTPLYEVPWSARNWMKPGCIVTPKNTREVAKVMKVLTARKTKFAVRSGGHTSIPGFASVGSDGVLVALQNLNKLAVSKDKKIATVGPGNRWGTVYQFLTPHGVSVAGGRLPDVGVGGFLLGGGLSFFYNQYGFGADQIARYRVVLTDGSIVDATPTKNANLYHGLKGGLTNLGVVTEFDLMTNNFVNFFYTVQQYNLSQASNLLKAYANYLTDENSDVKSSIQLEFTNTFALAFYGYGEFAAEPAVFESFRKIPAAKVLVPPTNGSVVALLSSTSGSGNSPGRAIGATVSHKVVDAKIHDRGLPSMDHSDFETACGFHLLFHTPRYQLEHDPRWTVPKWGKSLRASRDSPELAQYLCNLWQSD